MDNDEGEQLARSKIKVVFVSSKYPNEFILMVGQVEFDVPTDMRRGIPGNYTVNYVAFDQDGMMRFQRSSIIVWH